MEEKNNEIKYDVFSFENIDEIKVTREITTRSGLYIKTNPTDTMFEELLDLKKESTTHNAILTKKMEITAGQGLIADDGQLTLFIKQLNMQQNGSSFIKRICYDYWVFGAFAIQAVWSQDEKYVTNFYHIPFQKIRYGYPSQITNEIDTYYVSNDMNRRYKRNWIEIEEFNPSKNNKKSQLFVFSNYDGDAIYPLPDYFSAQGYAKIEYLIQNFNLNFIGNGCFPSMIVDMPIKDLEQQKDFVKGWNRTFKGSTNNHKVVFSFSDPESKNGTKILPVNVNDNTTLFQHLNNVCKDMLVTAHGLTTKSLAAISEPSGFANAGDEILTAYSIFYKTKIANAQDDILDSLNYLLEYTKFAGSKFMIEPYRLLNIETDASEVIKNTEN